MAASDASFTLSPGNETEFKVLLQRPKSGLLIYILVPLGSAVFVVFVIVANCLIPGAVGGVKIVFMLKRSRLDRLRHHLMPLYSFDGTDSGGDWETDLLEEERRQQHVRLRVDDSSPPDSPLLKSSGYHSMH